MKEEKLNEFLEIRQYEEYDGTMKIGVFGDFLESDCPLYLYGSGETETEALKDAVINLNKNIRAIGDRLEMITESKNKNSLTNILSDLVTFTIDPDENYDIEGNPL